MQTSEKDLASFARHHGHALESSDPQAVLDAEANLATVVNAEWLERLKVDIGLRFPRALTVLRHLKTAVGGKAPSNPFADCNLDVIGHAIAFLRNPASEDSDERDACLRWTNGPVRAANLDARNEVAASWCLTPLKSISLIEEAMRHESRLDWGQVGLGFGPYLEDVLRSCMFDVGRQAWEQGTRLEHRFYSPILESTFERGGAPTLVCFEAIAYLLQQPAAPLATLPELGPLGTRLVLNSRFVAALAAFRAERNRLHHAGRAPWQRDTYERYCDLLLGYPSASEWLRGSFALDASGMLGESGRNLLSSLLVNRYLLESVEREPDVGLTLLLTGFLQRSDLPSGWASSLLTSVRSNELLSKNGTLLALVKHAVGAGVLSPLDFSSTDMEGLFEPVSIAEALELVSGNALTPSDFPSTWKRHAGERSSWWQYQELLACGLFCPGEPDQYLRREKLNCLSVQDARKAVAGGVPPSDFDDTWRLRCGRALEGMGIKDAIWLLENGLLTGPRPSQARMAAWSRKASRRDAVLLVAAGLAEPSDFPPSWGPLLSVAAAQTKQE